MRSLVSRFAAICVLAPLLDSQASGQTELYRFPRTPGVVVFRSTDPTPAPTAVSPPPAIVPVYQEATTTYYAPTASVPAETTVYSPVVPAVTATEWTPVEPSSGVTSYSPVIPAAPPTSTTYATPTTTYYVPEVPRTTVYYPPTPAPAGGVTPVTVYTPTVTYQPVVAEAVAVSPQPVTAIPVGPQVTVRPKVYIQGQPIRNFFRAITP